MKHTINKERPNGGSGSFPSGHTSPAFQGAAFIHKRYGWRYSIPAYIGASFVGYSRVESGNHYIEDVLAGAIIGVVTASCCTTPYEEVMITPAIDNGCYGIRISKKWGD